MIIIKEEWEKGYYKTSSEKMKAIPTMNFDKDLILFIRWWQWAQMYLNWIKDFYKNVIQYIKTNKTYFKNKSYFNMKDNLFFEFNSVGYIISNNTWFTLVKSVFNFFFKIINNNVVSLCSYKSILVIF